MTTNNTDAELRKAVNKILRELALAFKIQVPEAEDQIVNLLLADRQAQKALNSAERAELESYRHQRAVALEDYHEYGKAPVGSPERLVAYISYLSPHNLRNGVQALRDWQETQKAQEERAVLEGRIEELDEAFVRTTPAFVEEIDLGRYWSDYYERRLAQLQALQQTNEKGEG